MRREDGVDQCRLSKSSLAYLFVPAGPLCLAGRKQTEKTNCNCVWIGELTDADDVELESPLQELPLNLRSDAVEADMALGIDGLRSRWRRRGIDCSHGSFFFYFLFRKMSQKEMG